MPDPSSSAVEALGSVRALNAGSSATELAEGLNRAVAAIREVAGDVTRVHERALRASQALSEIHHGAQAEARAEWVPSGDVARLEARYLLADGSVRFGRSVERIQLPDGSIEEVVQHGLLTDPWPVVPEQERVRKAYGSFALAYTRAVRSRGGGLPFGDVLVRKSWMRLRSLLRDMPGRVGEFCRRLFESSTSSDLWKRTTGVVDKTAGSGGELILVPQLQDLRRPLDLARRIPGLVGMKPAPSRSFKPLSVTGKALARLRGATASDPARYPVQRFTTADTTVTCVDRVVQALLDPLWVVDSASILDDPMGFVNEWLEKGDLDTLEIAFLHGDTAATHQDTIATWTLNSYLTSGDLDGSDSPAKFWIGFRARAADDTKTASAGGTWTPALHFARVAAMNNHGADAVVLVGIFGLLTQVASDDTFVTVDKMGDKATLQLGEVGSIGGKPVIISEFLADEFDSTSGLYTGSNSSSEFVYVDPKAYDYWELAEGADDYDALYPERGAQYVGKVRRGLLSPNIVGAETPCALLYNL